MLANIVDQPEKQTPHIFITIKNGLIARPFNNYDLNRDSLNGVRSKAEGFS